MAAISSKVTRGEWSGDEARDELPGSVAVAVLVLVSGKVVIVVVVVVVVVVVLAVSVVASEELVDAEVLVSVTTVATASTAAGEDAAIEMGGVGSSTVPLVVVGDVEVIAAVVAGEEALVVMAGVVASVATAAFGRAEVSTERLPGTNPLEALVWW